MEDHPITIDVQNVTKRYGFSASAVESLRDISFQVRLGQVCVLLGPNGSGKTTLLKTLAGLLQPSSGTILLHGIDPAKNSIQARSQIGWMPAEERSGFYGRLTGRENLTFFGVLQGIPVKEMDRIIGNLSLQIGLNDDLDKPLLKVSSGTKQKIGLARALLHNPPVLLLDEPMRNLDPHTILRFRRLITTHLTLKQHKTVLLSTHQLEEAHRMADIILIVRKGKIVKSLENRELELELKKQSLEDIYMKTIDASEREGEK